MTGRSLGLYLATSQLLLCHLGVKNFSQGLDKLLLSYGLIHKDPRRNVDIVCNLPKAYNIKLWVRQQLVWVNVCELEAGQWQYKPRYWRITAPIVMTFMNEYEIKSVMALTTFR
jgi:hypothetical protein